MANSTMRETSSKRIKTSLEASDERQFLEMGILYHRHYRSYGNAVLRADHIRRMWPALVLKSSISSGEQSMIGRISCGLPKPYGS